MPTIQDMAKQLNVSVATISRALNDKPGVSAELRQKILNLAEEQNYHPNQAALSLTTSKTKNILFVVHRRQPQLEADPFYPLIMQGMEEMLSGQGYGVTLTTVTDDQLAAGPTSIRSIQEKRADAVVFAGPDISPAFIIATSNFGLHVFLVDNALNQTPIPSVVADNLGGALDVTDHLIKDHGQENIVLLRGPSGWISSDERAAGYEKAMEFAGLPSRTIEAQDTTLDTGKQTAKEALAKYPEATAFFAVNDAMAIGAIRAVIEMGRKVPEDLAIVGFDNISWGGYADPPLTTVRVPKLDIGRVAARLLLNYLNESISTASRTAVATQIVLRESCNCNSQHENKGAA